MVQNPVNPVINTFAKETGGIVLWQHLFDLIFPKITVKYFDISV